jgi:nicotinate phosphoribosyltransferase
MLTDNDLYKFSTGYAYMKLYPEAEGIFSFCDRNNTVFQCIY